MWSSGFADCAGIGTLFVVRLSLSASYHTCNQSLSPYHLSIRVDISCCVLPTWSLHCTARRVQQHVVCANPVSLFTRPSYCDGCMWCLSVVVSLEIEWPAVDTTRLDLLVFLFIKKHPVPVFCLALSWGAGLGERVLCLCLALPLHRQARKAPPVLYCRACKSVCNLPSAGQEYSLSCNVLRTEACVQLFMPGVCTELCTELHICLTCNHTQFHACSQACQHPTVHCSPNGGSSEPPTPTHQP